MCMALGMTPEQENFRSDVLKRDSATLLHPPGEGKVAWTQALCATMASKQLSGSKGLARHVLRAICGSHSAYRDAKVGLRLQHQSQARALPADCSKKPPCLKLT